MFTIQAQWPNIPSFQLLKRRGFAASVFFYIIVKWICLGIGLCEPDNMFEDVTCFTIFWHSVDQMVNWENIQQNN